MSDVRPRRGFVAVRVAVCAAALVTALSAGAAALDPQELLARADAARAEGREGIAHIRATTVRDGKPGAPQELELYVAEGERALCGFRGGQQHDRRILVVGDRVWMIVPGASKPVPLSANQRLLGGAMLADVTRARLAEMFTATMRPGEESVDGTACAVLDLAAVSARLAYRTGVLWVAASDGLPRRLRLSLANGKPARELLYLAYRHEQGRPLLTKLEVRDLLAQGRGFATVLEFSSFERVRLDPTLFEPRPVR
jgi:outer membrane lipoprotein-sorting protein